MKLAKDVIVRKAQQEPEPELGVDLDTAMPKSDPDEIEDEDIKSIGEKIGIIWDEVDFTPEDLAEGTNLEFKEHGPSNPKMDVTGGDKSVAAKIAWAHLDESSDYYTFLEEMEKEL